MILYHGGTDIVKEPKIISAEQGRDFGFGFYTTDIYEQAAKWAKRQGRIRRKQAVLNIYEFDSGKAAEKLNYKEFMDYSVEWLEFIVNNRSNPRFKHDFDIVFGKIANDDVGETVQAVVDGLMPLDFALEKLTFMRANNQYAFCSEKSLSCVTFTNFQEVG
ncbi:MAG: DUF3990 domain-containing protein [Chitinispirillales bacterium]|jgi:hypothetical protein|nr:DUF3990 domain-containing protein [Chitinispirillales bacterium]